MTDHAYVLGAKRSPIGSFQGADEHQLTREAMDEFAIGSVTKARSAMASGALNAEIIPMGEVTEDEQPGRSKIERIGSRLIVTLAHALRAQGAQRGVASLCIGGGEATAIAIEAA